MKRTFDFGIVDFGWAREKTSVSVEYEEKRPGEWVFSASGSSKSYGGQCLDEFANHIHSPLFSTIHRLWKAYHLNDMHPECVHQNNLGWDDIASREVAIYHWYLNHEAYRNIGKIKDKAFNQLKETREAKISENEKDLINLKYELKTTEDKLPEKIAAFYDKNNSFHDHTEIKTLGWLRPEEHPDGILCKACPVCGYKYGTSWNYFPIPEDDDKLIRKLIETGDL